MILVEEPTYKVVFFPPLKREKDLNFVQDFGVFKKRLSKKLGTVK